MDIVLIVFLAASIALTTATLYLTILLLKIARKSLLSKILYDLLIVVILLWSHPIADIVSYGLYGEFGFSGYYFIFESIILPIASLYLIWDIVSYTKTI